MKISGMIKGLTEALAHAVISNMMEGTLAQRTARAHEIVQALTEAGIEFRGAIEPKNGKSPQAAGGLARAAAMTPEERSALASTAAKKRWSTANRWRNLEGRIVTLPPDGGRPARNSKGARK